MEKNFMKLIQKLYEIYYLLLTLRSFKSFKFKYFKNNYTFENILLIIPVHDLLGNCIPQSFLQSIIL